MLMSGSYTKPYTTQHNTESTITYTISNIAIIVYYINF